MGVLDRLFGNRKAERETALAGVRAKFAVFHSLLDTQNQVLKTIAGLEERAQGRAPFEVRAIRVALDEIPGRIAEIVERMIELGGDAYSPLRERLDAIRAELDRAQSPGRPVERDDFVVPFDRLGADREHTVGGKNANLGELKSRLGLPVPEGFAISAWAYKHFVDSARLQERITKLIGGLVVGNYEDLEVVGDEIRALIISKPVPDDLAATVMAAFDDLERRCPEGRFSLRSSAIGEDAAFTFAGQYVTFLNVRRSILLDCYREVLASKFTPAAIYYYLSHALRESDLAMGVGCLEMVDAAASGVLYTRDPLNPAAPTMVVNAIYGLGSYLVEGVLTPDVFLVSRETRDVQSAQVARKPVQLVMLPDTGVAEAPVPEEDQDKPAVSEGVLRQLAEYGLRVEEHYGGPQDIEWAVDGRGRLFLLQTRPLRMMGVRPEAPAPEHLRSRVLLSGGTCICPGAGAGPVFQARSTADLGNVPDGAVLVAPNPSPNLIAVMHKVAALVTKVGGVASHMATLARESGVPTVAGLAGVADLAAGTEVTVDATDGVVYAGRHPDLIELRRPDRGPAVDPLLLSTFRRVMETIAHLNLINSSDPDFRIENCRTLHDVTRFIHQKAMEEMFRAVKGTAHKDRIGLRLKTSIPLLVHVVCLDADDGAPRDGSWIAEDEIDSVPMRALWEGVLEEGWPQRPAPPDLKGFLSVMGSNIERGNQPDFSESSYAFVSREYMLLNLRMGYHFATIEALVTPEPAKNYIRMQYKEGGASADRRARRIALIEELVSRLGFENRSRGDFLDTFVAYQSPDQMIRRLKILGRINILTKQLDMALVNDAVARWYTDEFLKKLGLATPEDLARSGAQNG